jgi:anti-sigma B factor antagonist
MSFRIDQESLAPDVTVIKLGGDVDFYAAPELNERLLTASDRGPKLLVDLTHTSFIDMTTLGLFLSAVRRLRPRGGSLTVLCPDPSMRRVFRVVGLDRIFAVEETLDEALDRLT